MEVIYTAQNTELFMTFQILRCHTLKLNISAPNHGSDSVKAIPDIINTLISAGSRSARVLSLSAVLSLTCKVQPRCFVFSVSHIFRFHWDT